MEKNLSEVIQTIESLYPPDSQWESTAAVAYWLVERSIPMELWTQARSDDWRNLSFDVLIDYANECIYEHIGPNGDFFQKNQNKDE